MTRAFVCRCEDVDLAEVDEAIAAGYDDLESLRRFTALGTGPCQGKACLAECIRLLADHHGVAEDAIGLMTLRPPVVPIPLHVAAALTDELVEGVLEGTHAQAHRDARVMLDRAEASGRPRTGRPGPDDVGGSR